MPYLPRMRSANARPLLAALLLGLLLLAASGGLAVADEAAAVEDALDPAPTLSIEAYEAMLKEGPITRWSLFALKLLPMILGIGFLIALYVAWHRRQVRAPGPGPVEGPGPTVPFPPLYALGATMLAVFLGGAFAALALAPLLPGGRQSFLFGVVFMGAIEVPLAVLVIARRQQLRQGRITPPWRAFLRGFAVFCVGSAVAFPLAIVGAQALLAAGEQPEMQDVIVKATDPAAPENLWVVALFGVVVAPFAEEAIFRGLFFPALRSTAGGGRRGFWISAILVSMLFALIHDNAFAFLPLFGLAMVLSFVMEKTDSLSTCILGHAFYNASSVVPLLIARSEGVL